MNRWVSYKQYGVCCTVILAVWVAFVVNASPVETDANKSVAQDDYLDVKPAVVAEQEPRTRMNAKDRARMLEQIESMRLDMEAKDREILREHLVSRHAMTPAEHAARLQEYRKAGQQADQLEMRDRMQKINAQGEVFEVGEVFKVVSSDSEEIALAQEKDGNSVTEKDDGVAHTARKKPWWKFWGS